MFDYSYVYNLKTEKLVYRPWAGMSNSTIPDENGNFDFENSMRGMVKGKTLILSIFDRTSHELQLTKEIVEKIKSKLSKELNLEFNEVINIDGNVIILN